MSMNDILPKSSRLDDTPPLPTLELLDAQAAIPIARPIPSATAGKASLHDHGLTDQTNYLPTRQVIAVFAGLNLAVMVGFLDQTIVATALPRIASDLHSGKESAWVATSYLVTSLAFTPLYGRWSDIFGRKQVLIVTLGIFWGFSLACALSRTMLQLIVFRAFQGIGGGAIMTMVMIIIADVVSLKDRGKYQGITEIIVTLSNGCGPLLGGLFTQYATWRWAFWINLPLAGAAIAVALWLVPLKPVEGDMSAKFRKVDYIGSAITIIASVLLLLGLSWGGVTYSWTSGAVLGPLILGLAGFAAFMYWEAKYATLPIIPVHIFGYRTVVGVYISSCANGAAFFAVLYYVPQLLQIVRDLTPVRASALTLPFLAPVSVVVAIAGQVVSRTGHYRYLIIAGYTLWTISQGLQCTINEHTSTARIAGFLLLGGIGAGFTPQTSVLAAQAAVSRADVAVVTGVRNFLRLLGSTLAVAVAGALLNNALHSAMDKLDLSSDVRQLILDDPTAVNNPDIRHVLTEDQRTSVIAGYTHGFRNVFYMTVGLTLVAWLAAVLLIEQHELARADDKLLKENARARIAANKREPGVDLEKSGQAGDHVDELKDNERLPDSP